MKKITQLMMLLTLSLGISQFSYAHFTGHSDNSTAQSSVKVIHLTAKARISNSAYITSAGHQYRYQTPATTFNKYSAMNYSRQYLALLAGNSYLSSARSYWP